MTAQTPLPPVPPLLELKGVHTHIGQYHILHGVDLQVPRAQVTVLLGRNGAGKTTTLRTVMGLWRASAGQVMLQGQRIDSWPTPQIAASGVAYVPESMGIFSDLTVEENMVLAARGARTAGQLSRDRLEWIYSLFPALKTFWLHPAGKLSGGQKQMLSMARAMIEPRELLLIDEPSKGLAPSIIQNLVAALRELKAQGATVLLVEQNFMMARAVGDAVAVMDNGRIVHRGSMAALADDESLQQQLLGLSLGAHQ